MKQKWICSIRWAKPDVTDGGGASRNALVRASMVPVPQAVPHGPVLGDQTIERERSAPPGHHQVDEQDVHHGILAEEHLLVAVEVAHGAEPSQDRRDAGE